MPTEPLTPVTLINYFIHRLDYGGFNPRNRTKFNIVYGFIIWFFTLLTFALQSLFLLTNTYKDFGFIMIDIVILAGYWQLTMKLWTLVVKHRSINKILNLIEAQFWSVECIPPSERPGIQTIYNIANLAAKGYFWCIQITMMGHYITSYFRGKENLIMNIWLPETLREWNKTALGHHVIFGIEAVIMTIALITGLNVIDGIYITFIALVIAQLRILKCRLMGLNGKKSTCENVNELAQCVEHHNVLFDCLYYVEDIFSTQLLHVAGTIIIPAVLSMYCCMVENDLANVLAYICMFTAVNTMLFIYCFMGQLIQDETLSVADAAYMSSWEDIPDKNIRLGLKLVILRSHKYVNISMGGFFILCLETFTRVARMMLSLLTFMMNFEVAK